MQVLANEEKQHAPPDVFLAHWKIPQKTWRLPAAYWHNATNPPTYDWPDSPDLGLVTT